MSKKRVTAVGSSEKQPRGRPFQKGQSGNPSGRQKKTPELIRVEEMAKEHSVEALAALLDEAKCGKGAPRVTAAVALLDRAWGRPVERTEKGEPGDFERLSHADLERAITETERLIARATGAPVAAPERAAPAHPTKQD